jgi:hypothetical protein
MRRCRDEPQQETCYGQTGDPRIQDYTEREERAKMDRSGRPIMDRRPAISRKISRPAETGVGRGSSADRRPDRRPATPRSQDLQRWA